MPFPINGSTASVPVHAAGAASGRELKPGDVITVTVKAAGEGAAVLLAGREEMTARTELPLAAGQVLELLVEGFTDGVLILKAAAAVHTEAAEAGLLRSLGLPDTAAGRQVVAAMLAQRLPLDRETVLALTRAAGSGLPAAGDIPLLVFMAARGIPLTAENLKRLEELFAGRWLAEGARPQAGKLTALLERLTVREGVEGKNLTDKFAALVRAGQELADLLRDGTPGKEDGLSGLRERLELLRRLNGDGETGWGFLPALAGWPGRETPLVLAVRSCRRRRKEGGEPEQRISVLLMTPHLGRICARLRLRAGALTCQMQVEDAAVQMLADAEGETLAAALRACGYRASFLPCTVGRLDWLAEFWGVAGGSAGTVRRVDLTV